MNQETVTAFSSHIIQTVPQLTVYIKLIIINTVTGTPVSRGEDWQTAACHTPNNARLYPGGLLKRSLPKQKFVSGCKVFTWESMVTGSLLPLLDTTGTAVSSTD